ncbi:MAG: hypothetical protein ACXVNF_00960 [Neobacillus sp.]
MKNRKRDINTTSNITKKSSSENRVKAGIRSVSDNCGVLICLTPYVFETMYPIHDIFELMQKSSNKAFNIGVVFELKKSDMTKETLQHQASCERSLGIYKITVDSLKKHINHLVEEEGNYSDIETFNHLRFNFAHDSININSFTFLNTNMDEVTPILIKIAQQVSGVLNYYNFQKLHNNEDNNVNINAFNHKHNHYAMRDLLEEDEEWENSALRNNVMTSRHEETLMNNAYVIFKESDGYADPMNCVAEAYEEYQTIIHSDIGSLLPEKRFIDMLHAMVNNCDNYDACMRFDISDDVVAIARSIRND